MEIYHKKQRWVGVLFVLPLVFFSLEIFGVLDGEEPRTSDIIAGSVAICIGIAVVLQSLFGSTRFYFDNEYRRGVLEKKYFPQTKFEYFSYADISAIALRCYRRGKSGSLMYKIGFLYNKDKSTSGESIFYPLRSFSEKESGRFSAQKLATEISSHTKITYKDESGKIRIEVQPDRRRSTY